MAKAQRTTKLELDLGPRAEGGANVGKRCYLELTRAKLDEAREFYTSFFLAHPDKLFEKRLHLNPRTGKLVERLISKKDLLAWAEFCTVPTKVHPHPLPGWDFRAKFPDFPVVYRRSVINDAIGRARSYLTRLHRWMESQRKKGRPGLPAPRNHPVLYSGTFEIRSTPGGMRFVAILVFDGHTWVWKNYPVKWGRWHGTRFGEEGWEMESPQLVLRPGYAALHFPQARNVHLPSFWEAIKDPGLVTVAVDLNVKNLAVITVRRHGVIIRTLFVRDRGLDFHRYLHMRTSSRKQRLSGKPVKGERSNRKLWEHVRRMNLDFARKAAAAIVEVCRDYAGCILLFEQLRKYRSRRGEPRSRRLNRKLSNHLRRMIRDLAAAKVYAMGVLAVETDADGTSAHCSRCGMRGERFSLVAGSRVKMKGGKLFRCPGCGYQVNADFNASVNIHHSFYRELRWSERPRRYALFGYTPDGRCAWRDVPRKRAMPACG